VKVAVSNAAGQTTGFRAGQTQPVTEVRQSQFAIEAAWRDPSCTMGAPLAGRGVAMATMLLPSAEKYGIDVQGAPNTTYNFVVYAYDQVGGTVMHNFEGNLPASGGVRFQLDYNPAPGSPQTIVQVNDPSPATVPPSAPTTTLAQPTQPAAPTATTAPGQPTATPRPTNTVAPSATPTATPTPPPTPSPATKIAMQVYEIELDCTDETAITAVAFPTDANSRIPATTIIDFTVSRGSVVPSSPSTSIGRAEVKVYPGKNPTGNSVIITITARIRGTSISTSANVTCKTPIIIL
jgi:hypothetical protein